MPFVMAFRPFRWVKPIIFSPPFRVLTATVKTFFLGHLIWQYGFAQGATRGASMLPTFEVLGDSVIVSKQYRRGRNVNVGDVVQFDSVAEPRESVIKRVIGLEGDYVLRNSPGSWYDDMIQIPKGHCWVVGDNLDFSRDSRHFGPMPMALIRGKVIAKPLPWSERKWVENELRPVQD